jgi:predicted ATPase
MSVRDLYEGLVVLKKIERDRAQQALLAKLEEVEQRVVAHRSARRVRPIGWLFGNGNQVEPDARRPRQDHDDGPVLRSEPGGPQAPRALP